MRSASILLIGYLFSLALGWAQQAAIPRFEDYLGTETLAGSPVAPNIVTADQRMYRSRIRNGVLTGAGVWIRSDHKNPIATNGPNFAGRYFAIR